MPVVLYSSQLGPAACSSNDDGLTQYCYWTPTDACYACQTVFCSKQACYMAARNLQARMHQNDNSFFVATLLQAPGPQEPRGVCERDSACAGQLPMGRQAAVAEREAAEQRFLAEIDRQREELDEAEYIALAEVLAEAGSNAYNRKYNQVMAKCNKVDTSQLNEEAARQQAYGKLREKDEVPKQLLEVYNKLLHDLGN